MVIIKKQTPVKKLLGEPMRILCEQYNLQTAEGVRETDH